MIAAQDIRAHVEKNSERYLDALKEACSIPSVSAEGTGLPEMAAWLESRLRALGAKVTRLEVPGAPTALLGEFDGPPGPTVLIYDHYDVQPVDPVDLWETPPFLASERGGRLYARGIADNKGDLVARLCALQAMLEMAGELPFRIKFLVEGEEESGSLHFHDVCESHRALLQADHCIWEGAWLEHDGRPQVVYGCKGLLYLELEVRRLSGDQHSSLAAYVPSAAWELVRAISSMKDPEGRIAIEGFLDDVRAPTEEEKRLVAGLEFDEEAERGRLGLDSFKSGVSGQALKESMIFSPTANVAGFVTGYTLKGGSKTVLPAEALAKMDFRLVPDQRAHDIAAKVRRHLDAHGFERVTTRVLAGENPSRSPRDNALAKAVESAAGEWFDRSPSVWPLMIATGPMDAIAGGLGIPICSPPGVIRLDSNIHAPNENVRIADYLDIVGYTVAYLQEFGAAGGA